MGLTAKDKDMRPDAKLPGSELLGYLSGATGVGIFQALFSAFILVYYTNVAHVSPAAAGIVIGVSRVFDGLSDLIMGRIVDRTNSGFGKARPWIIRMIIPAAISVLLAFWQPTGIKGTIQIIYMFLTYNLAVTICNTAIAVPEQSLISYMTLNAKSRSFLGGMHMLGVNVIVALVVTSNFLKISTAFGNGDAYTQKGFTATIAICMTLYAVLSLICFFLVRERVSNVGKEEKEKNGNGAPTKQVLKSLFTNRYWLLCVAIAVLIYILMGATSGTTVYYAQYVAGDLDLQSTITNVYTISMLAALLVTIAFIIGRLGKKKTIVIGSLVAAAGYIIPAFSHSVPLVLGSAAIRGIGLAIASVPVGSILQDALTYGLWRDGFSSVGMGNAAASFGSKLGTALGTVILGSVLSLGGFSGKLTTQSASALHAIIFMYAIFPAIICVLIFICSIPYDLDGEKYAVMEQDIREGHFGKNNDTDEK